MNYTQVVIVDYKASFICKSQRHSNNMFNNSFLGRQKSDYYVYKIYLQLIAYSFLTYFQQYFYYL